MLSFGWNFDHSDAMRDRNAVDDERLDTLALFHAGGMWEIAVTNGEHRVSASVGDAAEASVNVLNVEGEPFFASEQVPAGQFREITKTVTVTDGKLTLDQGSAPDLATRINFLEIDANAPPEGCEEEGDEESEEPDAPTGPSDPATTGATTTLPATPVNINFQSDSSPVACGYTPDRGKVFGPALRHEVRLERRPLGQGT